MRARAMTVRTGIAMLGALVVLGVVSAAWAAGGYHTDEKFGFKVRIPKGFERMSLASGEAWVAAKYKSDKSHFYTDKTDGWTYEFKPTMTVITFIDEVVRKRGIEKAKKDGKEIPILRNPYKDYEDFLDKTYSGGGWYISKDETGKVGDLPVRKLEIKVEKLTSTGPKRIVTWIFDTDEVDFAVEFELLEDSYRKMKNTVFGTLKTFRSIPRKGGDLVAPTTGDISFTDEDKMTPEKRAEHRRVKERARDRKAVESLTDGWTSKSMGPFLVLNHADAKYARKVVAHAEAVWGWLDANLGYLGPDEYVPKAIIRICKDNEEQNGLNSGTSWGLSGEIVTCKDTSSGAMGWSFESVNRGVYRHWMRHRDKDFYYGMPQWMEEGLKQVLGTARSKGKKLQLQADQWELEGLRKAAGKGELASARDLLEMTGKAFWESRTRSMEAAAFFRFLVNARSKKTRAILQTYIEATQAVLAEREAEDEKKRGKETKKPQTEEEEDEAFRKSREAGKSREGELLKKVIERAFGGWSEKDWKKFEKAYRLSL